MRLFLCEKPSQAKDIAAVLGASRRGDGCWVGPNATVTWCIGHLLETAPPDAYDERYKRWVLADLPIIPDKWKMRVKPKTASQFKAVKRLLGEASELVIATDADREGEMIARELVEHCRYRGPIQRLWLSALDDASIRKALAALKPGSETFNLYHSALGRSRADWLIGMNMSRLFTLLGRQSGYQGVLPVGRVQTPTLRLVVDRDRSISDFIPVAYWAIDVQLKHEGQLFTAQWRANPDTCDDQDRCLNQAHAQQAAAAINSASSARVTTLRTERMREVAPLPFDLGTLQEVCSKKLGLGAQETLDVAQALYETYKVITYPRSDCGYLPQSQHSEAPSILAALQQADPTLGALAGYLDPQRRSRAWNDAKVSAHHGIIPTVAAKNLERLSGKHRAVYTLIRARYLAQFLPNHEYDRTQADFDCAGQHLRAVGKQIVEPGWKRALPEALAPAKGREAPAPQPLPIMREGLDCAISAVNLKDLWTQPPKPFTEGDLIKAMKNVAKLVQDPLLKQKLKDTTGIGTEATRAGIIQGLLDRGYLIKNGKALAATAPAFSLIDAVPRAIADPGTTAIWEQALDMVQSGEMTLDVFVAKQAAWMSKHIERCSALTLTISGPASPAGAAPAWKKKRKAATGKAKPKRAVKAKGA
ncbi:DNA topoisomerase III [Pseudomonas psychrophila]|uniref:DNA topoisomerase n=1 Tax=Pseudomonas psychrophila TaxID=122355 RepID=A0ABY0W228_9PSED|nr:DNA topoisomerase III [Pseudomonas psychrophila]KAB0491466.1 DNA topoisomerase III [Pseudomonas psychrophila]KMN00578.1 DNA topoisomerase III [Pseudomonas psychrophila]QIE34167.1 DNA topoisomerase III [Pseudomonas psychrophila]WVI96263.1 DNA topoisomerase III [Pseudomonas psychrophila]SDU69614.1 DNA topoisomerase-3 [Pseudomonas psychrophila]